MHTTSTCVALALALLLGACGAPQVSLGTGGTRGWSDSGWPQVGSHRGVWQPGYARDPFGGSRLVCDRFGRCWRVDDGDRFGRGDFERPGARPPDWAAGLPEAEDRFLRPRSGLVCDRSTRICYKNGEIDKSDTKQVFGRKAGKRADQIRDEQGTARVFVPKRGVPCDRERRVCLTDGTPDRKLTRRYFGRGAARDLD